MPSCMRPAPRRRRRAARATAPSALADYKVPETLTWSDEPLPRNANGKVMKRVLRERLPT